MAITFEAADGITGIDTLMCGLEQVTSAYLVEGSEPALVETGPTTSRDAVIEGLRDLGVGPDDLAHIVVTHIHLDHAGGAGALAPHFPRATVWVHERGLPHLAEPSKLVASAARAYGSEERLRELFGPVQPLPTQRMRPMTDRVLVSLGNRRLEAVYTPGHASHHVALFDSRTGAVFVGDALGVFLPGVRILRPAMPPPEFDLEVAVDSVKLIAAREPPLILFSHFGPAKEVPHLCQLAIHRMRKWTDVVETALQETEDHDEIVRILKQQTASEVSPAAGERRDVLEDRYDLAASYEMNAVGLARYLRKRAEARAGGT
jgi:glyoxylase-like metal-dependent hydrolase (beta-lactamase superfamily II)